MPEHAPLLRLRGIRKRYPGVVALDGVDFDLQAGEVHVLVGENGAGKSTLMKVVSGAVSKDAGEMAIDGRPVEMHSPQQARRLGISIIYQELTLVPHLSVAENVFLGKIPRRGPGLVDWRRMRAEADRLLRTIGTRLDVRTPVARLGIAQQQMIEVARALADEARVLIMDEPTSALSGAEVDQLFAAIGRLVTRGVGVVYISHRMDEVFRVGHRVTVLRDGRHIGTRVMADVTVPELVRMMANRDVTDQYPKRQPCRGDEVLRIERLTRRGVLDDVSLTVHRGEIVGIAGLVGAGRTELARALVGADPIDGGRVVLHGRPVAIRSPADAVRHRLAFLPEDRKQHGLVLGLSVQSNISLPVLSRLCRWGLVRRDREARQAQQLIGDLRIKTPGPLQKTLFLSGGNQQKVVLAKWLAGHADVFVFDEPTRGIDVAARRDIYELMNRLVEQGAGVLMISSDLPEVLGMSDRVLVMRGGRIHAEFDAGASDTQVLQAALGVAS